jgi:hypothetical protein
MATTVEIEAAPVQHAGRLFEAVVFVEGAPVKAKVTATLKQVDGIPPLWGPESQTKVAEEDGDLSFTFTVALNGPAQGRLESDVEDDQGTFYPPALKLIQVLP